MVPGMSYMECVHRMGTADSFRGAVPAGRVRVLVLPVGTRQNVIWHMAYGIWRMLVGGHGHAGRIHFWTKSYVCPVCICTATAPA